MAFFGGNVASPEDGFVSANRPVGVEGEFNHVEVYRGSMCDDFKATCRGVCSDWAEWE